MFMSMTHVYVAICLFCLYIDTTKREHAWQRDFFSKVRLLLFACAAESLAYRL